MPSITRHMGEMGVKGKVHSFDGVVGKGVRIRTHELSQIGTLRLWVHANGGWTVEFTLLPDNNIPRARLHRKHVSV